MVDFNSLGEDGLIVDSMLDGSHRGIYVIHVHATVYSLNYLALSSVEAQVI